MNRTLKAFAAATLLAAAVPALAHHSFYAEFDPNKKVTIEGVVEKMEWSNPHSWVHIRVTKPDGTQEVWAVEGGSPGVLLRLGWNKNSLPAGTKVIVHGAQAKDGSLRANSQSIEFPDGRTLQMGSSSARDKKED